MAKKQKKTTPERVPTKHQLSKWQRQMKIRRIAIIASVVFLVVIGIVVGRGLIEDYKSNPLREVVIKVNDVPFTMEYFLEMLDAYTKNVEPEVMSSMADYIGDMIADEIIKAELLRQGAENLDIEVTPAEIDARLKEANLPDSEVYRDIISAVLSQEKLEQHFGSQLPDTMEQAHVQVMLVESREVATELIAEIEAGGNFTTLVEEFSCNSSIEGDLGWLPNELMPNTSIADAAFNLTPGEISQPIYDETAITNNATTGGYWLVRVIDRGDHELAEKVKEELINKHFNDWFGEWKGNSTIENLLNKEKKEWAVNKVLEGR